MNSVTRHQGLLRLRLIKIRGTCPFRLFVPSVMINSSEVSVQLRYESKVPFKVWTNVSQLYGWDLDKLLKWSHAQKTNFRSIKPQVYILWGLTNIKKLHMRRQP